MVVDIPDVITSANFGEDRLRGLGVGVKVYSSPVTLIVALTTLSHCVIAASHRNVISVPTTVITLSACCFAQSAYIYQK